MNKPATVNKQIMGSYVLLLLLLFSGCTGNNWFKDPSLTQEQALNIFKEVVRIEPIHCIVAKINNVEYILCIANRTGRYHKDRMFFADPDILLFKLRKFADVWQIESEKTIYSEKWMYCEFYEDHELVKIDGKPFLYFLFSVSPMGNAADVSSLYFSLLSLTDNQAYSLEYEGSNHYERGNKKYIKGEFINLEDFSKQPEIISFLERKASISSLIYRPTSHDLDLNHVDNYEKKWEVDNSSIKDIFSIQSNLYDRTLRITYYDEDLFSPNEQYVRHRIENRRFKIISLFRNNIIGYDKERRKYFPIWVESCMRGCGKDIAFINESELKITYTESNNQIVTVDLDKMTCTIIVD